MKVAAGKADGFVAAPPDNISYVLIFGPDRGLVGERVRALAAAIAYCFEEMKLHRIMANYMPTNERSARLLRKLGFVPEGFARDYLFLGGTWRDHVLTSLTNPNWKSE